MTKRKRTGRGGCRGLPSRRTRRASSPDLRGANSNSGVSSAAPRVLTGDEDATFDTDPGDRALGTLEERRPSDGRKHEKPGGGRRS
jgi:hypothetical protein